MTMTTERPKVSEQVGAFLSRAKKMFINGEWVESQSGKTFEVLNPATEEVLAHVPAGNKDDIDLAVKAARKAFDDGPWSSMTSSERGQLMWKLADLIEANTKELAELECLDNGKPFGVARFADVPLAVDMFRYMAGWATKIEGSTIPISVPYMRGAEFHSYTLKEPVGVVGQIIPWNFPLLMAAWKIAPALATGCTVILKPAEETPLSALRLAELITEAGFPEGVVNIVTGHGEEAGAPLAAHPLVDKIAFTGSTEVGRLIVKAAGESNLKKVTLELGGKSPNVILPDADLKAAIPGAASAIFFNQGQVCSAGSRLYVHKDQFDEVMEGVVKQADGIVVGNGMDRATNMGPLVSKTQFERVTGYLEAGKKEGATAAAGGSAIDGKGYFVKPTVLVDTKPDMKVVCEEIFGPVVTATPYSDLDELARVANDTEYGLAAGIWTTNLGSAHKLARRIKAGSIWVNCYNVFDAALPFGGYKQSGWGREMGREAVDLYTQVKAVTCQL